MYLHIYKKKSIKYVFNISEEKVLKHFRDVYEKTKGIWKICIFLKI